MTNQELREKVEEIVNACQEDARADGVISVTGLSKAVQLRHLLDSQEEKKTIEMRCEHCSQVKPDAYCRPDGYKQDVCNDPHAFHISCDECDYQRNQDI